MKADNAKLDVVEVLDRAAACLVLPDYIVEVERLSADRKASAHDFSGTIDSDRMLSGIVLDAVNSSFYGMHRKALNTVQAVQAVGISEILGILRCRAVLSMFDRGRKGLSDRIFQHGFAVGSAAVLISSHLRIKPSVDFFLAGLVHDIGKILISTFAPELFEKFMWVLNDPENLLGYHRLEGMIVGITHSEAGAALLERLGFSPDIRQAVLRHHADSAEGAAALMTSFIHIADVLGNIAGHTPFKGLTFPSVEPGMLEPVFELKKDFGTADMMSLLNRLDIEMERLKPFYASLGQRGDE